MKKKKRVIIFAVGALVLIGLVVVVLLTSQEKRIKVQAEEVSVSDLTSIVTATGRVEPKTQVKISANVSAKITRMAVEEGDTVTKGQLLLQLEPDRYQAYVEQIQASLSSMEAQLRLAQANLEKAELDFQRQKGLYDRNLTSQEAYDIARVNYNVQKAQYESALNTVEQYEAQLKQAQDELNKTTITAPMLGVVTALYAEEGENVIVGTMNNPGTVIMVISDLSKIEIKAEVDETDVGFVKLGQKVDIELDAYPDTTFRGIVTEIGSSAQVEGLTTQEQVVNFIVTILLLDEVFDIKPGMSATVDITTDSKKEVLNIPIQAVVMRELTEDSLKILLGEKPSKGEEGSSNDDSLTAKEKKKGKEEKKEVEGVFVVRQGNAHFAPVSTGIADQQNIEITKGLVEADTVITGSYRTLRTLKDGDKVKIEKAITETES
jgi:HlyD family secretion protein